MNNKIKNMKDKNIIHSCKYYIVWRTKNNEKIIDKLFSARVTAIIKDISGSFSVKLVGIETDSSHVHILIEINPKVEITNFINSIRTKSDDKLKKEFRTKNLSFWSENCFISTVGGESLDSIIKRSSK